MKKLIHSVSPSSVSTTKIKPKPTVHWKFSLLNIFVVFTAFFLFAALIFLLLVNVFLYRNLNSRVDAFENYFTQAREAGSDYLTQDVKFQDQVTKSCTLNQNELRKLQTEVNELKQQLTNP